MALGADTWAAQEVLRFRYIYGLRNETLKLFAAVPFDGQELQWTMAQQQRYQQILANCDGVFYKFLGQRGSIYGTKHLYDRPRNAPYRRQQRFCGRNSANDKRSNRTGNGDTDNQLSERQDNVYNHS